MQLVIASTWDALPVGSDERVELEITRTSSSFVLNVSAPFHGDPPPPRSPGSCERLWDHEVVECFLVGDGERYLEIEMGPHGHYLLLWLEGTRNIVRQGMAARYDAHVDGTRWRARLELPLELAPDPVVRLNAFAIHGTGEARRYLCFQPLPAEVADFHQLARFPRVAPDAFA